MLTLFATCVRAYRVCACVCVVCACVRACVRACACMYAWVSCAVGVSWVCHGCGVTLELKRYPVESCLSGIAPTSSADIVQRMWYRITFNVAEKLNAAVQNAVLHFGSVDWQAHVFLNGKLLGNHTGGYDGFSFDISAALLLSGNGNGNGNGNGGGGGGGGGSHTSQPQTQQKINELLVHVFDPSDLGAQPRGKQRIAAVDWPGGGTYVTSMTRPLWFLINSRTLMVAHRPPPLARRGSVHPISVLLGSVASYLVYADVRTLR